MSSRVRSLAAFITELLTLRVAKLVAEASRVGGDRSR
jgi:hypothetical protein